MLADPPLLLITDRSQARDDLADVVAAACAGGIRWVSLREKDLPEVGQIALFHRLRAVTAPFGVRLTLHGSVDLAAAAEADGVHLPGGGDPAAARARLGADAIVGISVHGLAEARALAPGADYITASPVFATSSKPGYGPALGLGGLRAMVQASAVPVVALAGIDAGNAGACRDAGAAGIAVMGGLMRADDPAREAQDLITAWRAAAGP